jgi:hypothetical protein
MMSTCVECTRLWEVYVVARSEHLRIQGRVQAAALACNEAALEELQPVAQDALACRLRLREDLHVHGAGAHDLPWSQNFHPMWKVGNTRSAQ